ncbi:hypothetical protein AGMMS50289_18020 [Betaproteobacteria bacterium]|nr:hypothetical protein AGMMS50289_18020 [Betaproteobacteria bacterium]
MECLGIFLFGPAIRNLRDAAKRIAEKDGIPIAAVPEVVIPAQEDAPVLPFV